MYYIMITVFQHFETYFVDKPAQSYSKNYKLSISIHIKHRNFTKRTEKLSITKKKSEYLFLSSAFGEQMCRFNTMTRNL